MKNNTMERELLRIENMKAYEYQAMADGHKMIAGFDEAGRGSWAGPVVAAAVILKPDFFLPGINDSKKVSPAKRGILAEKIKKIAIDWAVAFVSNELIDRINILNATLISVNLCLEGLTQKPDFLLLDAMHLHDTNIKQRSLIKGDSLSVSIASASILAKVERDSYMDSLECLYPGYGFVKHKGYGTAAHRQAIEELGPCPIHRYSYKPIKTSLGGNVGVN